MNRMLAVLAALALPMAIHAQDSTKADAKKPAVHAAKKHHHKAVEGKDVKKDEKKVEAKK